MLCMDTTMKTTAIVTISLLICIYLHFKAIYSIVTDFYCNGFCNSSCENTHNKEMYVPPWKREMEFSGFDNETGTYSGEYIVPNFIHFIQFGKNRFEFARAMCILSAFKNHRPEKLFIHTDQERFQGRYWNAMMNVTGFKDVLVIQKMSLPTHIFEHRLQPLWKYYHGGDVARLEILMKYGGIYLDTDCYVVRSLNDFRRFEMTLPWQPGRDIGNQILIAHKSARFLRIWYNSYRSNYRNTSWSYNSGKYPGRHILASQPELVHRVDKLLGVYGANLHLFRANFPTWRDFYTFHLVTGHTRITNAQGLVTFDEKGLLRSNITLRKLFEDVYPFVENT